MTSRPPAYRQFLDDHGARWMTWHGVDVVRAYGEEPDPAAEYRAVRFEGAGLADRCERGTVVIAGDDAVPWLQGMVTNDVFALAEEGSGQRTNAVTYNGRLISDMRILHVPDMLLVDLEPGRVEELLGHLRRHVILESVDLADRSASTARLGLYGKMAAAILDGVAKTTRPASELENYCGTWGTVAAQEVIIQKNPVTGADGFEIFCDADAVGFVWRAIRDSDPSVRPVGHDALELLRLEAGDPRFGVELTDAIIPLEASLQDTISFNKGCYNGQEIITRLDTLGEPAKLLRLLVLDAGAYLMPGAVVEHDGKKVGEILMSAYSPLVERPIAHAYVKRGHNAVGTVVDVRDEDGESYEARVEEPGYALREGRA